MSAVFPGRATNRRTPRRGRQPRISRGLLLWLQCNTLSCERPRLRGRLVTTVRLCTRLILPYLIFCASTALVAYKGDPEKYGIACNSRQHPFPRRDAASRSFEGVPRKSGSGMIGWYNGVKVFVSKNKPESDNDRRRRLSARMILQHHWASCPPRCCVVS